MALLKSGASDLDGRAAQGPRDEHGAPRPVLGPRQDRGQVRRRSRSAQAGPTWPRRCETDSVAYNDDGSGSVSVSFGAVEVPGTLTLTPDGAGSGTSARPRRATTSASTQRYGIPGVVVQLPGRELASRCRPAASATFRRPAERRSRAAMQNTRDATIAGRSQAARNPRQWLSEASGYLWSARQAVLRLGCGCRSTRPRGPRRRRRRRAEREPRHVRRQHRHDQRSTGNGVNTGAEPLGYLSKVSAFELGITSGPETLGAGRLAARTRCRHPVRGRRDEGDVCLLRALDVRRLGDSGDGRPVHDPDRPERRRHVDTQAFTTRSTPDFTRSTSSSSRSAPRRSRSRTSSTRT